MDTNRKVWALYSRAHYHHKKGHSFRSSFYSYIIYRRFHCIIPGSAVVGSGLFLPHPLGVVIGAGAVIGRNCVLYQGVTVGKVKDEASGYPTIGNDVVVYANSVIAGDVEVGDKVTIGCNSSIFRSVKSGATVGGLYK